jgi:GDP-4-dehydro-6-deoxy-D-mannose reductase
MKALVTGAGSFVGRWLVAHLRESGDHVVALDREGLDVRDAAAVSERVRSERPEALYHLAAVSSPRQILQNPSAAFLATVFGTVNVLEAIRAHAPACAVLIPGSVLSYVPARPEDLPLREEHPLEPRTIYAATKIAQEAVARSYAFTFGLRALVTRSFNHIGPGQSDEFVVPALVSQIIRGGTVRVGNLHAARDFTDVRDVVRAYRLLVLRGEPGVPYNVCSGRSVTVRQIVDLIAQALHIEVALVVDPARVRPDEPKEIRGTCARLRGATGWQTRIPLARTLSDVIESLREGVSQ